MNDSRISRRNTLLVLHPVFALTGAADALTGPMLPAIARAFHLSDSQSGLMLFWVFAGLATGALLCFGNYARVLGRGFLAMMLVSALVPFVSRPVLFLFAFLYGVSVGVPMTAVSMFVGRNYAEERAATLTMLNFSWSAGALLAPLIAARILAITSWQNVYLVLAGAAALAAVVVHYSVRDTAEAARAAPGTAGLRNARVVALFAVFLFLEVGMEVTYGAWTSTYILRITGVSLTRAAAAAAIFWVGFLASRGLSPFVLHWIRPANLLRIALATALAASALLLATSSALMASVAILSLGIALAPIFPVALSVFFDRARHSSDSRFVLSFCGFGGSVIPWIVGFVSARSGSLRMGLLVSPVVLLGMMLMLPWLRVAHPAPVEQASAAQERL